MLCVVHDSARGPAPLLWALVLVVLVTGTGLSVVAMRLVVAQERDRESGLLEERTAEARLAVGQELRRYRDLVTAVADEVDLDPTGSRATFDRYVDGRDLTERYAGIAGLNFVVPVDRASLAAARERVGAPDAPVTLGLPPGTSPDHLLLSAGRRADGGPTTLGTDLAEAPPQVAALRASGDAGVPLLSAPDVLVRDRDLPADRRQRSLVLVAPVYDGPTPATVEGRRRALRGWVTVSIRGGDLIADALQVSGEEVDVELLDGPAGRGRPVARLVDGELEPVELPAGEGPAALATLEAEGRTLTLRVRALPAFAPPTIANAPAITLGSGLGFTALLAVVTALLVNGQRRALALAARSTASLEAAKRDLEARQRFTETLLDTVDVAIAACDAQGRLTYTNRLMREVHGVPDGVVAGGRGWADGAVIVGEDGRVLDREDAPLARVLREGELHGERVAVDVAGRPRRYLLVHGRHLPGPDGTPIGAVLAAHDITAQRAGERALRRSEERFRTVFARGLIGLAVANEQGRFVEVNAAMCDLFGVSREEILGRTAQDFCPPQDRGLARETARLLATGASVQHSEQRFLRPDGSTVVGLVGVAAVPGPAGQRHQLWQILDITARKGAEDRLAHRALHDPLTGLPNRSLLQERLGRALARHQRQQATVAVAFLDLDGFKAVNDTYGHDAGDTVLREVGRRLEEAIRASDTAARLGGDEFVVLLEDLREGEVHRIVGRLRDAVAEPILHQGRPLAVTASVGVTFLTALHQHPDDVLREADAAMYRAKVRHRDRREFAPEDLEIRTVGGR